MHSLSHLDFGEGKQSSSILDHIFSLCVMVNDVIKSESLRQRTFPSCNVKYTEVAHKL